MTTQIQNLQQAVAAIINQRSDDDLLTAEAAAAELGIKPQTLANWRCTHRVNLPHVKIGKRAVRYRWGDVVAFKAAGRVS